MENLFEEEQRLGHICLKPVTSASTILTQHTIISDDDEHHSQSIKHKNSSSSEIHDDDDDEVQSTTNDDNSSNTRVQHPLLYNQLIGNNNVNGVDLSRTEIKTGNLLTNNSTKSPSPLTPSPSPPNESLLQILANQILKTKQQETGQSTRLLTIASPTETKSTVSSSSSKRNYNQMQQDDEQQNKWNEAAMTLLSLKKPPPPPPSSSIEQQTALQSIIHGFLRKTNPLRATIDYHSNNQQPMQYENFHQQNNMNSFSQLKTFVNYFSTSSNNSLSMPPLQQLSNCVAEQINTNPTQSHEPRGDMMPLKLRMKMLNAKS